MSSDNPTPESENQETPKKARSPIERCIVWGGIVLLLLIALLEARAQQGYTKSLKALEDAVSTNEGPSFTLDQARDLMAFAPSESSPIEASSASDNYQFSWLSIFKSGQFEITVTASRDETPEVIKFATPNAPAEMVRFEDGSTEAPMGDGSMMGAGGGSSPGGMGAGMGFGGPGGGSGFGGPGGGRGFGGPPRDPVVSALDADEDGEISEAEIADAVSSLQSLDSNGDGELTPDELFPAPPGGFGGFGAGRRNTGDSDRPQRPAIDEN